MLKRRIDYRNLIETNITEQEIFEYYFGRKIDVGRAYSSIFRKDQSPSTGFYISPNGRLLYNDFTTGEKLNCYTFVSKLFNINYPEAIKKIITDFKITKEGAIKPEERPQLVKEEVIINVVPRPLTERDLKFWSSYNITKEELEYYNIYSVNSLLIRGKLNHTGHEELRFAFILDNQYAKIYSPDNKDFKWISNIPLNKPFGLDTLKKTSDTLVITKSLKDLIVLRKYIPDSIALQNESLAALSQDIYEQITKDYKHIKIFFDNDEPGKKALDAYHKKYGFEKVMIPERANEKFGVKDPSDYIKQFGEKELKKIFKWLHLIN